MTSGGIIRDDETTENVKVCRWRCRPAWLSSRAPSIRRLESHSRLQACSSLRPVHVLLPLRTAEKPAVLSGVYRVLASSTPRVGGGRGCGKECGGAACSVWRDQDNGDIAVRTKRQHGGCQGNFGWMMAIIWTFWEMNNNKVSRHTRYEKGKRR